MYTVTLDSPKGKTVFKYSEHNQTDIDLFNEHIKITSSKEEFSILKAEIHLNNVLKDPTILKRIENYKELYSKIVETIYNLSDDHLDDFNLSISFENDLSQHKQKKYIPKILYPLIDIYSHDRGVAVGKGEILYLLMYKNCFGIPNARYDVFQDNKPIHIKDHRFCDATPLGRIDQKEQETWRNADILNFIKSLGANFNFGNSFFMKRYDLDQKILDRYKTSNLKEAASLLEAELNQMVKDSNLIGEAEYIVFLKKDQFGFYFERCNKEEIKFHSISHDGIKITTESGRFIKAIMSYSDFQEKIRNKEQIKKLKLEAKLLKKETVKNLKDLKKLNSKIEKENKKLLLAEKFNRDWNNASNLDILYKELGIKVSLLKLRKKKILNKYPQLVFKELSR